MNPPQTQTVAGRVGRSRLRGYTGLKQTIVLICGSLYGTGDTMTVRTRKQIKAQKYALKSRANAKAKAEAWRKPKKTIQVSLAFFDEDLGYQPEDTK